MCNVSLAQTWPRIVSSGWRAVGACAGSALVRTLRFWCEFFLHGIWLFFDRLWEDDFFQSGVGKSMKSGNRQSPKGNVAESGVKALNMGRGAFPRFHSGNGEILKRLHPLFGIDQLAKHWNPIGSAWCSWEACWAEVLPPSRKTIGGVQKDGGCRWRQSNAFM